MARKSHDRFELIEELGEGSSAVVWRALDTKLNRTVALKILSGYGDSAGSQEQSERAKRFEQETQAAARLNHPNIVGLLEAGSAAGGPHIAYELVEGVTLREWVNFVEPKPIEIAVALTALCDAVDYAHSKGVIHRDIKPENILVDLNGKPYITDFGLAQLADKRITEADVSVGTVAYLAPEQAAEGSIDGRADVFSLGVVLFEMLSGELPFRARTRAEYLAQLTLSDAPELTTLNRDIHADLAAICSKCLNRIPSRRYTSARELRDDLERFTHGQPTLARPQSIYGRGLRALASRSRTAVPIVVFLVVLVLTVFLARKWSDSTRASDFATILMNESDDATLRARLDEVPKRLLPTVADYCRDRLNDTSLGSINALTNDVGEDSINKLSSLLYVISANQPLDEREQKLAIDLVDRCIPQRAQALVDILRTIEPAYLNDQCDRRRRDCKDEAELTLWTAVSLSCGFTEPAVEMVLPAPNQRPRYLLLELLSDCNLHQEQWQVLWSQSSDHSELAATLIVAGAESLASQQINPNRVTEQLGHFASFNTADVRASLNYLGNKLDIDLNLVDGGQENSQFRSLDGIPLVRIPSGSIEVDGQILSVKETFWTTSIEIRQAWIKQQFAGEPGMEQAVEGMKRLGDDVAAHRLTVAAAMRVCNRLSRIAGKALYYVEINDENPRESSIDEDADGFRIPSQQEWEWMARCTTVTPFFHGAKPAQDLDSKAVDLNDFGWFRNSQVSSLDSTFRPGGLKRPNQWGLFDVYGNVSEIAFDEAQSQFVGCGGVVHWESFDCYSRRVDLIPTDISFGLRPICF